MRGPSLNSLWTRRPGYQPFSVDLVMSLRDPAFLGAPVLGQARRGPSVARGGPLVRRSCTRARRLRRRALRLRFGALGASEAAMGAGHASSIGTARCSGWAGRHAGSLHLGPEPRGEGGRATGVLLGSLFHGSELGVLEKCWTRRKGTWWLID